MKKRINSIIALAMTALLLATEIGSLPVVWAAEPVETISDNEVSENEVSENEVSGNEVSEDEANETEEGDENEETSEEDHTEEDVQATSEGDYTYTTYDDLDHTYVKITKYNGSAAKVSIPDTLGGYTVTTIGDSAFEACDSLTEVKIPDTVTKIETEAFMDCTKLTKVELSSNLQTLGAKVFLHTAIYSVKIPKSLTSCGTECFYNCGNLETVEFEEGITKICANLFYGTGSVKSITIPDTVTIIGSDAFNKCTSLAEVYIPDGVITIGDSAFEACSSLVEVIIPDTVKEIETETFKDCTKLTKVIIPSSVIKINESAFQNCPALCIYCYMNSYALIYAIDNDMDFKLIDTDLSNVSSSIVDMANTRFYTSAEAAIINGFVPMTLNYSIPHSTFNSLTNKKVAITFTNNLELIESSVTLNGSMIKNYDYSKNTLTIDNITDSNGTLQFYATPLQSGKLAAYARFLCTQNGASQADIMGVIYLDVPLLKINVPSQTSQSSFDVTGVTLPSEVVVFDINGVNAGTAKAKKDGTFSTTVTMPTNIVSGTSYTVTARLQSNSAVASSKTILYKEGTPSLIQFDMYYYAHDLQKLDLLNADGARLTNTIYPGKPFKFVVRFDNYENLGKVLIASTKSGITNTMQAEKTDNPGEYVAEGYFDGTTNKYAPGTVNVLYTTYTSVDDYTVALSKDELPEEWKDSTVTVIKDTESEYLSKISLANDGGDVEFEIKEDVSLASLKASLLSEDVDMYSSEGRAIQSLDDVDLEPVKSFFKELKKKYKDNVISNIDDIDSEGGDVIAVIKDDTAQTLRYVFYDSAIDALGTVAINYFGTYWLSENWIGGTWGECSTLWGFVPGGVNIAVHAYDQVISIHEAEVEVRFSESLTAEQKAYALKKIDELRWGYVVTDLLRVASAASGCGFKLAGNPLMGTLVSTVLNAAANLIDTFILDRALAYYKAGGQGSFLKWLIDPSGYVYDVDSNKRIEGVATSAYWIPVDENDAGFWDQPPASSQYGTLWDASEYSQQNPLITDSEGCYAWEVPEGWWRVKFEKDGYETIWSDWMTVPPIQTGVNIGMKNIGGTDNPDPVKPESVSLNVTSLSLYIGDEHKITYSVAPVDAVVKAVSVNSSVTDVATAVVNTEKTEITVTAIKVGTTVITLDVDGCTALCSVTVLEKNGEETVSQNSPMNPVPVIDENTTEIHLVKGQKFTLPESGWTCKDKRILAVSKKNVVTAKKVTTTPVKLIKGDRSIDVYITKPVMAMKSVTILAGSSQTIGFSYDSEHLPVLWYSNAPDVATVSGNGMVSAVGKGTATLTAFVNGSAYTCKVKVKEDIAVQDRTLHMTVNAKKTISIKGVKKVTWVSDDEKIASVTKKNKVTAIATGETVLRTEYEGKEYRIKIYVEDPTITSASIQNAGKNKYKLTLSPGTTTKIELASIDQPVIFKSNKGEVAYVDADGTIVTNRAGKAKLTAKINGKTITITVTVQ